MSGYAGRGGGASDLVLVRARPSKDVQLTAPLSVPQSRQALAFYRSLVSFPGVVLIPSVLSE